MLSCFGTKSKTKNIILFGLEDAGKSSILYRLKYDAFIPVQPTIGYNCEVIPREFAGKSSKTLNLRCLDLPGAKNLRLVWSQFMNEEVDGLIYVIDMGIYMESVEYARKCKQVLWETLDQFELLDTCPLLVYLNKTDLNKSAQNNPSGDNNRSTTVKSKHVDPEAVREIFQSLALPQLKNRSYQICPCSALTGEGLQQGISWLTRVTLSKTECRDKTVIKNYNLRANGSKIGKFVNTMASRTSLKEALDAQLPLSASISRIRKHIPYNPLEDEYLIEKNRKMHENVQEPVAPEDISLQEVRSPPESTIDDLHRKLNSELRKTQPDWRDKIDKRYNQLNTSMTEIRIENQEKRKKRVSDISAIATRGRSPGNVRRPSHLRRSASNPLSKNNRNSNNHARANSTSRSINKSCNNSEKYSQPTNRSFQTQNSVILKNQKTWHPTNNSEKIPPAEPSECSNFYQSRKNIYKYISQNAQENGLSNYGNSRSSTPLKLDQISDYGSSQVTSIVNKNNGPLQLRYCSRVTNNNNHKNPTEILRRKHQRTVEYQTPSLMLESFDTKKSDSFRFQSNSNFLDLENGKLVDHSTPLDNFLENENNGVGDVTPLTSKKRNSLSRKALFNQNSVETQNTNNLSPLNAVYSARPGSVKQSQKTYSGDQSSISQYKMTSQSDHPDEMMLPEDEQNPTQNLCSSTNQESEIGDQLEDSNQEEDLEVLEAFKNSTPHTNYLKVNKKLSRLSNEINEIASTCNSTMEGSYILNKLDHRFEMKNRDLFEKEDEEKRQAKNLRRQQFQKRFREIFSSDCDSDYC